jgi:hypothetical protein
MALGIIILFFFASFKAIFVCGGGGMEGDINPP